jgi:hypothetical protein
MPVRFQHLEIDPSKPIRGGLPISMLNYRPGVISTAYVAQLALAAVVAAPAPRPNVGVTPSFVSGRDLSQSAGIANRWFFCLLY